MPEVSGTEKPHSADLDEEAVKEEGEEPAAEEEEDEVDHLQRYLEMQSFTVGVHHPKKHPFDNDSKTPQSPETRLALSALKGRRRAQQFSTGVRHLRNTRPS